MSGNWAQELLGEKLLRKGADGKVEEVSTKDGFPDRKFVGLYFSAHWCGPCRRFTPLLGVCYEDSKDVEIVFVSSDDDIDGFNEYYGEMGWAAVPFGDADRRSALSERFGVSGIPALIILDAATGALVTTEGRAKVADKKALDGVFTA